MEIFQKMKGIMAEMPVSLNKQPNICDSKKKRLPKLEELLYCIERIGYNCTIAMKTLSENKTWSALEQCSNTQAQIRHQSPLQNEASSKKKKEDTQILTIESTKVDTKDKRQDKSNNTHHKQQGRLTNSKARQKVQRKEKWNRTLFYLNQTQSKNYADVVNIIDNETRWNRSRGEIHPAD